VSTRILVLAREAILTIVAAVGVLCLVGSAVMLVTGVTPVVFRSGSMSPAMPTGALALVQDRPARTVMVGDVVSVVGNDGVRITHRVVDLRRMSEARMSLTTRGDANLASDIPERVVSRVDVVIWSTPWWGYAVEALQAPAVIFGGGLAAGSWVTWWMIGRRRSRSGGGRGAHSRPTAPPTTYVRARSIDALPRMSVVPLAAACSLVLTLGILGGAEPTRASFVSDGASASSRFSVDTLGTRIARTRDSVRATNGTAGAVLAASPATSWTPFSPPPFRPTALAAEDTLTFALNGASFAYKYGSSTWRTRALPATGITAAMMTRNSAAPVVIVTNGSLWWYSNYPAASGTPGAWTRFTPTNAPPAPIVDVDSWSGHLAATDGTGVRISANFGNLWSTVTAPGGTVDMIAYSGTTLLAWGPDGWSRSTDDGQTWAPDDVLDRAVPRPTDIAGGTSASALGDNRFFVASGSSSMWRYDGATQTLTAVNAAY